MDISHIKRIRAQDKNKKEKVTINYIYYIVMIILIILLYKKTNELLMCFFMIGLIGGILSIVHMYIAKRALEFEVINNPNKIIGKNELTSICIRVHNRLDMLSPYIYVFTNKTDNLEVVKHRGKCVMVKSKNYIDVEIPYKAKYSGKASIYISEIVLQDFFGIMSIRLQEIHKEIDIAVLPQVIELKASGNLISSMKESMNTRAENERVKGLGELSYDLEPYKEGDSMKLVHQKLLARRDIYMVREREKEQGSQNKYVIVIDPVCGEVSNKSRLIDKTLAVITSLISDIIKQTEKVTVVYNIEGKWSHRILEKRSSLTQFMNTLARYSGEWNGKDRWAREYLLNSNISPGYKLVITPILESEYIEALESEIKLEILTIHKNNQYKDTSLHTWYLSDEYEVSRYV